jgi:hypothetical protein
VPKPKRSRVRVKEVEVVDVRDATMARLAAARASAQAVLDAVDESLMLFVNPDEDKAGRKRKGMISDATDAAGEVSRALEAAQSSFDEMTGDDLAAGEPDDDEEDDDEDDEDLADDLEEDEIEDDDE